MSHPSQPHQPASAADPLITAAVNCFAEQCERDQFGSDRPEASLCFIGGDSVVIRNSWGEVIGRVSLTEILSQQLN